jgi:teichoic acid transport system permease protein
MEANSRQSVARTTYDQIANFRLILSLAWNDFRTKYAGSMFGTLWAFAYPVVTVVMYWFVFQVGMGSGPVHGHPFVLWLVAGLVPWMYFQDALNFGTDALRGYSFLVKKISFNISILPAVRVVSAFYVHAAFLVISLTLFTVMEGFPGIQILQVLYYSFCTTALALGIVFFTSAVAVFFRDITQVIMIGLQVGTWATPILWQLERIDPRLHFFFKLNPMNYVVQGYRNALLYRTWFWEQPRYTAYFWVFTLIVYMIGVSSFQKLKKHFADVL